MLPRRSERGAWILTAAVSVVASAGCGLSSATASDVLRAATPDNLPHVVACWERVFEESGFTGAYDVTVDFDVDGDGRVHDTVVDDVRDVTGGSAQPVSDGGAFAACVTEALDGTDLGNAGLRGPVHVVGYRISFTDPSHEERRAAAKDSPSLLVGPRADRCQGLYGHEPPRDLGLLHKLLSEAEGRFEDANQDRRARAHQRAYDLTVELVARLERDLRGNEQPKQAKKRLKREAKRVRALQEKLGREIGCPTAP